ncbi:hypothetical protein M406DRAFT_292111 [Cryphonectria parasitica EP155]|uniref:LIM zinc-binding domain-containing protein n=1 Tax=Cryphonectria parasitica (strain ATCC 38755 / EP155) TaxID=660469 RepID=A0A9P4Y1M7_CRYP1|nr:uncharacterized protein M406DRAFT_292111 [Cryphonectria parasitica EP155]KAF3764891.1 hypothetical protein M406DRAFT_292111 [Cryphonectria parasitica EP155]
MFDRGKPKESAPSSSSPERKMAPAQGSYMNNEQFSAYLRDLRNNRVNRPGGARPQPLSTSPESRQGSFRQSIDGRPSLGTAGRPSFASTTRSSIGTPPPLSEPSSAASIHSQSPPKTASTRDFSRPSMAPSVASRYSTTSGRGRDYYPDGPAKSLNPGEVVPSATYMERGQRWMEKEEAVSLRQALEDKDASDRASSPEEDRLYEAALDEASELVWQHQHGIKPPEPGAPYRYKQHLRKNSYAHARAASTGLYGDEIEPSGLARDSGSRSVSGSSASSDGRGSSRRHSSYTTSTAGARKTPSPPGEGRCVSPSKSGKPYNGLTGSSSSHRRRPSVKRDNSKGKLVIGDKISEEPEGASLARSPSPEKNTASSPASSLRKYPRSPFNRVSLGPGSPVPPPSSSDPTAQPPKLHKYEIHRNPPSQSRNPQYTTNSRNPSPVREDVPKKHGMEIRGDDIRQATSMKLKDRSPKLPTPTAVSDRAGRPIVSFDKTWKAPDEATDEKPDTAKGGPLGAFQVRQDHHRRLPETPPIPAIAVTETRESPPLSRPRGPAAPSIQVDAPPRGRSGPPSMPSIVVNDDKPSIPSIVLPGDDDAGDDGPGVPIIVTPDDDSTSNKPSSRPLPAPQKDAPKVRHAAPRPRWPPAGAAAGQAGSRATARCHDCGYPIEGRFIALAGTNERFHPHCFSCYICGTSLEALEISPEPDPHRAARLERIHRRAAGEVLEEKPGETMAEDGDERLRFYCHLDWHELFAPRCKHCTTPILGEHIVALGEHWHYGHFFCAECGDPFEQGMTHIEKDGYAWCVNCQTKRTERRAPKCKMCRKAVIGQYIRALGGEWHDECFRCATCQGGFDDGQIFPRESPNGRMVVLCTKCRERELKG